MPIRIIFQRFVPQGCGFFISTMSCKLNSLSSKRNPAFLRLFKHLISSFFVPAPLLPGDYKGQGAETVFRFHAHLIEV
jgi:hypothetical protein